MAGGAEFIAEGWEAVRSGRPGEAERLGRQAVQTLPNSPEGWFLLGLACHCQGRPGEAADYYAQALRRRPDYPEALINLGSALQAQGRPGEAEGCFRRTLQLRPNYPEAYFNLGNVLLNQGHFDEAAKCYERALEQRPGYSEAHNNLGNALQALGRPDEAAASYQIAIRTRPGQPEAHNNLGNALRELGRPDQAAECYQRALGLRPDYTEALINLGSARRDQGRFEEAAECYRRALDQRPDLPGALNNLGAVLLDQGRPGQAEKYLRRALRLQPEYPDAHTNLGNVLRELGRLDEAVECYQRALGQRPDDIVAHDGLLLTLHYRAGVTLEELATAHADYQHRHALPLRSSWRPHGNDPDPDRPLRLGFASADLGCHPVGFLLIRVVEALARRPGFVICYSDRIAPDDELTARFKAAAGAWRDTTGLTDERLAELVRADGVDVLFDLAGHTANNRLLTFARRPAPVQVTWLGYAGTTGLEAIDYLLADRHQVPPNAEVHYRERVLRMPDGYACYDPPAQAPPPGPPPALRAGRVTFGSFNNPSKLTPPTVTAWASVLRQVPRSRIVLKYRGLDDPSSGGRLLRLFATEGVGPDRIELRGASAQAEHLAAYGDIDIALDSFPYGGGVTTCEALWMGVPVVTLPLATFASRHALSYLSVAGLADLVARDVNEYVALAANLSQDLGRLENLRAGLRQRVAQSPLCDGERFADHLLGVLRGAWRVWATGNVSAGLGSHEPRADR